MKIIKTLKEKKIILLVVVFVALLIANFLLKRELAVIKATPDITENVGLRQDFSFLFNQQPVDLVVETVPSFPFQQEILDKKLSLTPQEKLKPNTNYTIVIKSGEKIVYSHVFKTRLETETEVVEEETKTTLKNYPLIGYLPIDNERYHLTYTGPFELTVTVKQGSPEQIREEIVDWISSKKIDPSTHQIIFD